MSVTEEVFQDDRSRLEISDFLNIEDMFSIRDVLSLEISSPMIIQFKKEMKNQYNDYWNWSN